VAYIDSVSATGLLKIKDDATAGECTIKIMAVVAKYHSFVQVIQTFRFIIQQSDFAQNQSDMYGVF
jgi:hypothetical protein